MSEICEFKKGNWLLRKKTNEISNFDNLSNTYEVDKIDGISENYVIFFQNGTEMKVHVDDIFPIPLSEEILSNSGFELFLINEEIVVYSKKIDRGIIFVSNMHEKGWKLSSNLDGQTYFDVPYVHVMQNKYRKMAQKEWDVYLSNPQEYIL